ncbi:MAG: hypothetical protein H0V12_00720 [Chloroflexi bacterium]|nr:hypothetical protein [Chloroflexota bacterium]
MSEDHRYAWLVANAGDDDVPENVARDDRSERLDFWTSSLIKLGRCVRTIELRHSSRSSDWPQRQVPVLCLEDFDIPSGLNLSPISIEVVQDLLGGYPASSIVEDEVQSILRAGVGYGSARRFERDFKPGGRVFDHELVLQHVEEGGKARDTMAVLRRCTFAEAPLSDSGDAYPQHSRQH